MRSSFPYRNEPAAAPRAPETRGVRCRAWRQSLYVTALLMISSFATPAATIPATPALTPAESALEQGRADEAVRLLQAALTQTPADAHNHQLLCRVFLSEEMPDSAIPQCEQAVALQPNDSDNQMWLGRAYGQKAEKAGPLSGLSLAKKVRVAFERAVALDSTNIPAAEALGEFYVAAPSLVGGGLEKARHLTTQVEPHAPARAHHLRALVAEKARDYTAAEAELRLALTTEPTSENWVDLGNFYQRRGEPEKAVGALQSAIAADAHHGAALADVASILTDLHRSPELAEKVLRLYLATPSKSEAAPAFKVHVELGRLLAQRGDMAGAHEQYAAALQLASNYAPARKALGRP